MAGAAISAGALAPFALPTPRAAEWLAMHAPIRDAAKWSAWLRHNARASRHVRYRVKHTRIGTTLMFAMTELAAVRKFEMERASKTGYSMDSLEFLFKRQPTN